MSDETLEISLAISRDALDELEESFTTPLNRQERIRYCIERTLADARESELDERVIELIDEADQLRARVAELEEQLED